jgi:uncharacterized circularly permuted ATP-grasp superfamily protein
MFDKYEMPGIWDEFFEAPGVPRKAFHEVWNGLSKVSPEEYLRLNQEAESALIRTGITFVVYGDNAGQEKIMPFDLWPRVITAQEWRRIEKGLAQRIYALNLFLDDVYHEQKILHDGVVPRDLVLSATSFRKECIGLDPPRGIWIHVTGTDLIRDPSGEFLVLEDNLRCPSGVSYVLENRELVKRSFPQMFEKMPIRTVENYSDMLFEVLDNISPRHKENRRFGVLTPGVFNSAYFEHSYLARKMGTELVEGQDLVVDEDLVYIRTTHGFEQIDVLYRRIDDDFLDPLTFRPDSMIGVPGLFQAYRKGNIALANAPGTGIADDKAIYAYVPAMIKYYTGEEAILPNVQTYLCDRPKELGYVLAHLDKLVVKATNESGGYGMLMGHQASKSERDEFALKIQANPRSYIAQPVVDLSQAPTLVGDHFEGRRVDLRPYILYGEEIKVLPGGLSRVALKKGSLVVNSSQGGGSKDTWVLQDEPGETDHA